jgi:hypothetical protein
MRKELAPTRNFISEKAIRMVHITAKARKLLLYTKVHLYPNLVFQKELISKEEWDYLIVLDGCSYDYFEKTNPIKGKLTCAVSPATGTALWAKKTWTRFYDAIYVSANPNINSSGCTFIFKEKRLFDPRNFVKVLDVWDKGWKDDGEINSVLPETVNSCVISNMYPRMIIHYLQPHAPFIGEVKMPVAGVENIKNWLKENNLDMEYYKKGYTSNLERVLKAVRELLQYLDGRVVITSDHGYWDGSNGKVGHRGYSPYLQKVPWLEVKKDV